MPAIPVHHTATIDEPWDGPAAEAAMPNDAAVLKYCHAWQEADAPRDEKSTWKFPHHKKEGGPANLSGCRNGLARLDSANIPDNDRAGVKAHLEAHLNDAKKKQSSASPGGHHTVGRTAAVPTIQMLESDAQAALDAAQKRSAKAKAEIEAIVAGAAQENRANLTPEEDTRVGELLTQRETALAEVDTANSKIARIRLLAAQDDADQQQLRDVSPTGAPRPKYDEVARVGREERTYHPGNDRKGAQFLRDTVQQFLGDRTANERLARHMAEEKVERGQQITRAVGTPGFTGLTVPQYLTDFYAPAVAAMRPFADACNHHDLPADGMTVNISRITTPATVALQASENAAVANSPDMADTLLTENVQTAAGAQTLSRQAIERGTGIEEVVMDDLFRRYATDIDSTLINQATTGLAAVANAITYTDSAPSGEALWPKLLQGAAASEAALLGFAQPNAVIMHSRRWYWLSAQLTSQWPMFGQPGIGGVAAGENLATVYGHGARGVLPNGMVAIADNNVATNLGGGTNQDEMFVVATQECHLWEDPSAPVYLRCEQPVAANLGVLVVLYGYFCYSLRRYPNANSVISGTGLIAPVF